MSKSHIYVSPDKHEQLRYIDHADNDHNPYYLNESSNQTYPTLNGIPNLTYPTHSEEKLDVTKKFYDDRVDAYEDCLHLTFYTHNENENEVRKDLVDLLNLSPDSKVLEIAAGTGRDSVFIAERLSGNGQYCIQDLSLSMLQKAMPKLEAYDVPCHPCVSNASYLPYPDNYFDAVYSFGGIGEFPDIGRSLREMVRVGKKGATVVVGDESIPPWLRNTEFAKILSTTNPQFMANLPLESMPVEARNTMIKWIIGGVFYVIKFEVGEGEPTANFDFNIPGLRGGTYRTRYEGHIEGVQKVTKEKLYNYCKKNNVSVHDFLEKAINDNLS